MAVVRVTPTKNSGKYLGKLSIVLLHDAINVCSTTVKLCHQLSQPAAVAAVSSVPSPLKSNMEGPQQFASAIDCI